MAELPVVEDTVTVSTEAATVEKTLETEDASVVLAYAMSTRGDGPLEVKLVERLPLGVSAADVHPDSEGWTVDGYRLVFEGVLAAADGRTVTCVVDLPDAEAVGAFVGEPSIETADAAAFERPEPSEAAAPPESSAEAGGDAREDPDARESREDREVREDQHGQEDQGDQGSQEAREAGTARAEREETHGAGGGWTFAGEGVFEPAPAEPATEEAGQEPGEGGSGRLSTGIEVLDRELGGGIPPGRMIALLAPPDSQSELIVEELVAGRDTLYISTVRPGWEVREELQGSLPDGRQIAVEYTTPEALLEQPLEYLDRLDERTNLVVDCVNGCEMVDRGRYLQFLNAAKRRLYETGSIGLVYGTEEAETPPCRGLTLNRADLVWRLRTRIDSMSIENRLVVTKFRGGRALTEPIKLVLTDEVEVDTSRDIA